MTHYLKRLLKQTATYWAGPSSDGWGGYEFSDPVTVNCRWIDRIEVFTDESGREQRSKAVVLVESDVVVGGYIALGDYSDSQYGDPTSVSGAYQIKAFAKVPNYKGTKFLRKVWV